MALACHVKEFNHSRLCNIIAKVYTQLLIYVSYNILSQPDGGYLVCMQSQTGVDVLRSFVIISLLYHNFGIFTCIQTIYSHIFVKRWYDEIHMSTILLLSILLKTKQYLHTHFKMVMTNYNRRGFGIRKVT